MGGGVHDGTEWWSKPWEEESQGTKYQEVSDLKNVEAILAEFETKTLKSRLREFPALIKAQKDVIRQARSTLEELESDRKMIEADIMTEVSCAVDPRTGKPQFSNDKSRAAELMRRCSDAQDYRHTAGLAREAAMAVEEAQDELERLQNDFRSYRYIVSLTTAELELLAGCEVEEEDRDYERKAGITGTPPAYY